MGLAYFFAVLVMLYFSRWFYTVVYCSSDFIVTHVIYQHYHFLGISAAFFRGAGVSYQHAKIWNWAFKGKIEKSES